MAKIAFAVLSAILLWLVAASIATQVGKISYSLRNNSPIPTNGEIAIFTGS